MLPLSGELVTFPLSLDQCRAFGPHENSLSVISVCAAVGGAEEIIDNRILLRYTMYPLKKVA